MKEKIVDYDTRVEVEVIESSKELIAVAGGEPKEGYLLIGHGMTKLPNKGDKGYIIFERDKRRGHWQYYPNPT